jgi:AraC-like DNA-binding protein
MGSFAPCPYEFAALFLGRRSPYRRASGEISPITGLEEPGESHDMIGLLRVLAPARDTIGAVVLDDLPLPPAASISACAVGCRGLEEVDETLNWYEQLHVLRPELPLGLIAEPADCARQLARYQHPLAFLLSPGDLRAEAIPSRHWELLLEGSLTGTLREELCAGYEPLSATEERTIRILICRGMHGATVSRVAKDLNVSVETVRRRIRRLGITPSALLRQIRHRAYELRVALGTDRRSSLVAAGWSDHEQRRKARARLLSSLR